MLLKKYLKMLKVVLAIASLCFTALGSNSVAVRLRRVRHGTIKRLQMTELIIMHGGRGLHGAGLYIGWPGGHGVILSIQSLRNGSRSMMQEQISGTDSWFLKNGFSVHQCISASVHAASVHQYISASVLQCFSASVHQVNHLVFWIFCTYIILYRLQRVLVLQCFSE